MPSLEKESATALPLVDLHRELEANLKPIGDLDLPVDYGRFEEEFQALAEGAAWVDLCDIGRVEVLGADRARLLSGLTSCEIKELPTGQGVYGFFTGPQGKILADVTALALEDRIWLQLPPGKARPIRQHIEKYIIADQVELMPLADMLPISIVGPKAEETLSALGDLPPQEEGKITHGRVTLQGTEVHVVRQPVAGLPAFTLWISASIARPFLDDLFQETGLKPAGRRALEAHRVLNARPQFGHDFDEDHFPQESGREEEGVSYTKGCYLGQEVVARIHYRGGVNRAMCQLQFEGAKPEAGAALSVEGKEVGAVGSTVTSPDTGETQGLAVIHRRGFEADSPLEVAGGGQAKITQILTKTDPN